MTAGFTEAHKLGKSQSTKVCERHYNSINKWEGEQIKRFYDNLLCGSLGVLGELGDHFNKSAGYVWFLFVF